VKASNLCARTFIFISFSFIAFLSSFFPAFFAFLTQRFITFSPFFDLVFIALCPPPPFALVFFCEHAGELHIIISLIEREFTKQNTRREDYIIAF
jgi:hypothetical protein